KIEKSLDQNNNEIVTDAISALENLGYKRSVIYPIVSDQVSQNTDITLETLITQSLRLISNK
ncbi:MAG: Holliday junction resolvasome RuvABC DNA-binding subunit, partial [Rickettsiales bacterium]